MPLPDWAHRPAPQEARPSRPLAPSALGADDVADPPPTPELRAAARRGQLLHALFERLPAVSAPARRASADRWLQASAGVIDAVERQELISAALGVIDDARFAALFGPQALAETPIAAVVDDGFVVSGTVDRLVVTDDHIAVVDFKTGRRVPESLAALPAPHLRQMAAYVAALEVIFPGRPITASLLYTGRPILFDLPPALIDAHKPRLGATEQSLVTSA